MLPYLLLMFAATFFSAISQVLLKQSAGTKLEAAKDVEPGSSAWLLAGISVGCTVGAAVITVLVLRLHSRLKKRRKTAKHHNKA